MSIMPRSVKAIRTHAFLTRDAVKALFYFMGLAKPLPSVLKLFLDQVLSGSGIDILVFADLRLALWAPTLLHLAYTTRAHERCAAFRTNHNFANDQFHANVTLASFV